MRVLCIGDTHFPFHHRKALIRLYRLADRFKPTHVVQLGDLFDQFSFSRYPKLLKITPDRELADARSAAEAMWSHFKGLSCYQLMGNHDDRALKKALSVAPELAPLIGKSLRELYSFTGVTTINDGREELRLGKVFFHHGHRAKLGDHAKYNQECTAVGHSHNGGTMFFPRKGKILWELNAGFLGDINSPAFGYHAQKRCHTTTLGCGTIDEHNVPCFHPLE